jgi:hypothetical protein
MPRLKAGVRNFSVDADEGAKEIGIKKPLPKGSGLEGQEEGE